MKKVLTLIIVHTDEQILLGMKKRGFGAGRWNGFGGKVAEHESVHDAAFRELMEEAGIVPIDMRKRGDLLFTFDNDPVELEVHLFVVNEFKGEPGETEEMRPQWYAHHEIPYGEMWSDDKLWLPHILARKGVTGRVHFDNPTDQTILNHLIETYD